MLVPVVDAGPCAQRIPIGPGPGQRSPAVPPEPLAGAAEPAGPCGLGRLAAPVLAGCHRPSPVGSPLHPILAGRSRRVEKAPRHNRLCRGAAMPGPASRAVPPRPCRKSSSPIQNTGLFASAVTAGRPHRANHRSAPRCSASTSGQDGWSWSTTSGRPMSGMGSPYSSPTSASSGTGGPYSWLMISCAWRRAAVSRLALARPKLRRLGLAFLGLTWRFAGLAGFVLTTSRGAGSGRRSGRRPRAGCWSAR
jgi:hypothetical protein